jgi:hypothetical protein
MKPSHRTVVLAVLCIAVGFALSSHVNTSAVAQTERAREPLSGAYQISAFGGGADSQNARYGAYVINTQTGKVWLIREGGGELTPITGTPPER